MSVARLTGGKPDFKSDSTKAGAIPPAFKTERSGEMAGALPHARRTGTLADLPAQGRRRAVPVGCRNEQTPRRLRRSHGRRRLFGAFVEEWVTNHARLGPSTLEQRESRLRTHVLPFFRDRPLGSITRSDIQTWVNGRAEVMAPSQFVVVCYSYLSGAFKAAVEDRLIARTPCYGIKLPRVEHPPVQPIPTAAVHQLVSSVRRRYLALLITAAGTGMRQGECFGLTLDRVDVERGVIVIDRQLVQLSARTPRLGPPKTQASYRTIPLPDLVARCIVAQVRDYGTGTTVDATGREVSGVIFTGTTNVPVQGAARSARSGVPL